MSKEENTIDDLGTTQEEAQTLLQNLNEKGFDDEIELLAIALGRPTEEIIDFMNGDEIIDEDLVMKIRGIARQRDIDIE
jgi:hypothetical protein